MMTARQAIVKHIEKGGSVKRFVVYCWEAVASYAHSKAPEAVCEVLAASPESAQDAVREASCGHYEAFETHSAENNRFQEGLTFEEFRDMHLERVK